MQGDSQEVRERQRNGRSRGGQPSMPDSGVVGKDRMKELLKRADLKAGGKGHWMQILKHPPVLLGLNSLSYSLHPWPSVSMKRLSSPPTPTGGSGTLA